MSSECDGNSTKYVFHLFALYVAAVNVKCYFVETQANGIYHIGFGISLSLY